MNVRTISKMGSVFCDEHFSKNSQLVQIKPYAVLKTPEQCPAGFQSDYVENKTEQKTKKNNNKKNTKNLTTKPPNLFLLGFSLIMLKIKQNGAQKNNKKTKPNSKNPQL